MKYTIIVVNYNKEKYLKRCLTSIMNQTYNNFNLIIVDDGSTDKSKDIINSYSKYKNVSIYFKENTQVADTRNFAIKKVKTKYFLFVDSDDYIDKYLLEECSKYKDYDVLSFNNYIDNNKNKIIKDKSRGSFTSLDGCITLDTFINNKSLFLVPWGYIYNRDFFIKNNFKYEVGYVCEDVGLTTIIILQSRKTISIDYYGYYYVLSDDSIIRSKNSDKMKLKMNSMLFHYQNIKKYLKENIKDKNMYEKFLNYYNFILINMGLSFNRKMKKIYIKKLNEIKAFDDIIPNNLVRKVKKKICSYNFMLYYYVYPLVENIVKIIKK